MALDIGHRAIEGRLWQALRASDRLKSTLATRLGLTDKQKKELNEKIRQHERRASCIAKELAHTVVNT